MKINVCLICDNNYAKYAGVTITSILKNAKDDDELSFYIIASDISEENKKRFFKLDEIKNCKINIVTPPNIEKYSGIQTHSYISSSSYYILNIAELIPQIEKVIYLDCDVIVNTSLSDLFSENINDFEIAGVHDIEYKQHFENKTYVNSGMLLMNLRRIRENKIEEAYREYINTNIVSMGDQEIINNVLKDKIKILDDKWNVQVGNFMNRSMFTKYPYIIHYVSYMKPWLKDSWAYWKNYYFEALKISPWYEEEKKRIKTLWLEAFCGFFKHFNKRPFFFLNKKFFIAILKTLMIYMEKTNDK